MNRSLLVKLVGFPATLIHGGTLVLDRWRWLRSRLPLTRNGERLLEIGCGAGAFTIGAALRGYDSLGLSWDAKNQDLARHRAVLCRAPLAKFEVQDVRTLESRSDLLGQFDVLVCCETVEHILDDRKLFRDMAACLKPGGRMLLTTPYYYYPPRSAQETGPFSKTEDGWHVRRGYTRAMLEELATESGFQVEQIDYCSGFLSQKITQLFWGLSQISFPIAWVITAPLRVLPPLLDPLVTWMLRWPYYGITLEAYKPRY